MENYQCEKCGWTMEIHNTDGSCPNNITALYRSGLKESCDTCIYRDTCEITGDLVLWCKSYAVKVGV